MTGQGRRWRWVAAAVVGIVAATVVWRGRPAGSGSAGDSAEAPALAQPRLTSQATLSAGVVHLMVTGNAALARGTGVAAQQARAAFDEAVKRDERYAPAHAGFAQALVQLAASGTERAESVLPSAIAHCDRAIELDPTLALAWQSLAQAEVQWTRDWPRAEMHYRRAISLAPGSPAPVLLLAKLLAATGRGDQAIAEVEPVLEASAASAHTEEALGRVYRFTGRGVEAGQSFDRAATLDPARPSALAWRVVTLAEDGKHDEALTVARGLEGDAGSQWAVGYAHALAGRRAEALEVFAAMSRVAGSGFVPAIQFAYLSAALGESTQALDWIETAVREHSPGIEMLAVEPILRPLGRDPRFAAARGALKLDAAR